MTTTEWTSLWMELPEPDRMLRDRWAHAAADFVRSANAWGYPAELADRTDLVKENEVRFTDPENLPSTETLLSLGRQHHVEDLILMAVGQ